MATTPTKAPTQRGEILTPLQVADRLQIPLSAVYEKTRSRCANPLPVHQIGRYLRFQSEEIDDWFAAQVRKGVKRKAA